MLNSRQSPFSTYLSLLIASLMVSAAWASSPSPTTTTLTISPSPVSAQAAATLTAAVLSGGNPVTPGLVLFCDAAAAHCTDINILGQAQLISDGMATVKLRLGIGSHSVKAEFQGTKSYAASASSEQTFSVTGAEKTTTDVYANLTNFAARVVSDGKSPATGEIQFLDATNKDYAFASAALNPMSASYQFAPLTAESGLGEMVIADFNGDGIPDVVTNAVAVLLGNGDGTFTTKWTDPGANAVAVGDFNSDGIPDLAVASGRSAGTLTVLLGKGDGTFTINSTAAVEPNPQGVTVGDFNGDGIPDLVTWNNGTPSQLDILLGNGNGTFSAGPQISFGSQAASVVVGDFRGDGIQDLAVLFSFNMVDILLGKGDGTFTISSTLTVDFGAGELVAGDFNGDGIPTSRR